MKENRQGKYEPHLVDEKKERFWKIKLVSLIIQSEKDKDSEVESKTTCQVCLFYHNAPI